MYYVVYNCIFIEESMVVYNISNKIIQPQIVVLGDCELMEKRILIQQRALACLSKSVAHILQRELYTMGSTGLLLRDAEMTLLHPHLGASRRQELRNSPFWPTPLFKSQLVKDGEDFLLKKALLKTLRVLDLSKQALSWSPPQQEKRLLQEPPL